MSVVVAIKDGNTTWMGAIVRWDLRLTLSNLRSLCNRHHAIKMQEDKRMYGG